MAVGRLTSLYSLRFFKLLERAFFQVPFQQLRLLISVSFTARNKFFYSTVRSACLQKKKHDTYHIVYTLMDTAFSYEGNLHRTLSSFGNSHCYLYTLPLNEKKKTNCNCK